MKNWWILLIIIVILVILILIILPRDKNIEDATINLKDEYNVGEEIVINTTANKEIYYGSFSFKIFRKVDNTWLEDNLILSWHLSSCSNLDLCGAEIASSMIYPGCIKLEKVESTSIYWDQQKCNYKTINCTDYKTNQTIEWSCEDCQNTEPGDYKFLFDYTLDCPYPKEFGQNATIKTIEKEFKII